MKGMRISAVFVALSACALGDSKAEEISAPEMPFIYGEFGFKPEEWSGGALTRRQSKELEQCKAIATPREKGPNLSVLYGLKEGQADFYGATLTGCLSDEKDGKGWSVSKRTENGWQRVTSRMAVRSFLGLDETK